MTEGAAMTSYFEVMLFDGVVRSVRDFKIDEDVLVAFALDMRLDFSKHSPRSLRREMSFIIHVVDSYFKLVQRNEVGV